MSLGHLFFNTVIAIFRQPPSLATILQGENSIMNQYKAKHLTSTNFGSIDITRRLIRQVCEVLIFNFSLSQSVGLASHPLSATLLG
ncbi:hypothetical protein GmHk_12G034792 [Glycine max]|nr:hypothetical protein GmHk_12G034792 [Glycine max]